MKQVYSSKTHYPREIVKMQISILSSEPVKQVLVYNATRTREYEGDATKEVLKIMDGDFKKFFYAQFPKKPGLVQIFDEAPWQDW